MAKCKVIKLNKNLKDKDIEELILPAANCIKEGGIVVFPTETVYGIGANAFNEDAVKNIFLAKLRPSDNPLIVHVSDFKMLETVVDYVKINDLENTLINTFMPGPFTLILTKKKNVPNLVSAKLDTIGVRIPKNLIARKLIELAGVPVAAPSANVSGKPSGTVIEDIYNELKDKVDYIIDDGITEGGIESTVAKVIDNVVVILRPGKVSKEDIEKVVGENAVRYDEKLYFKIGEKDLVESPGMKYKHYAPEAESVLIYSDDKTKVIEKIAKIAEKYLSENKKICIMTYTEDKDKIVEKLEHLFLENLNVLKNLCYLNLGSKNNLDEVSKNIFTMLRKLDEMNIDFCIIQGVKTEGLGVGIMNRLIRACNHNYIEV